MMVMMVIQFFRCFSSLTKNKFLAVDVKQIAKVLMAFIWSMFPGLLLVSSN